MHLRDRNGCLILGDDEHDDDKVMMIMMTVMMVMMIMRMLLVMMLMVAAMMMKLKAKAASMFIAGIPSPTLAMTIDKHRVVPITALIVMILNEWQ